MTMVEKLEVADRTEAAPVAAPAGFVCEGRDGSGLRIRPRAKRRASTGTPRRHALKDRGDDLYQTPIEAVAALLSVEQVPDHIWEPACGPGAIVRELRACGKTVTATDLVDYGCPDSVGGRNFLTELVSPPGVQAVITNPPFKDAEAFVRRSRALVPETYMLLRLAFLESQKRQSLFAAGDLAKVWVFRSRLPRMHREGWKGKKVGSQVAFAWFVWRRNHKGPTEIGWLNWKGVKTASVRVEGGASIVMATVSDLLDLLP